VRQSHGDWETERQSDRVTEWQSVWERDREREKYKDRERVNIFHRQVVVRLLNAPWTCMVLIPSTGEKNQRTPMGWLRWVGSLRLQVSFAEYSLSYRALLQKRPIITNSLLIEATPYIACMCIYMCDKTGWIYFAHVCRCVVRVCVLVCVPVCSCASSPFVLFSWIDKTGWMYTFTQSCRFMRIVQMVRCTRAHYIFTQNVVSFIGLFCKRDQ